MPLLVSVQVPVPDLAKPPAPEMAPSNVLLVLSDPAVNTAPALKTKLPPVVPPPVSEPTFKLLLSCNNVPMTLLSVTAELLPKALTWLVMTLPLLIVVLPV